MRKRKLAMWKLCTKNKVEVSGRKGGWGGVAVEGGESALKLYAQQYKSSSDSAHKLLIQFQRYFSFSSQIFLFFFQPPLFPFKE
jgi:hypothetical protein